MLVAAEIAVTRGTMPAGATARRWPRSSRRWGRCRPSATSRSREVLEAIGARQEGRGRATALRPADGDRLVRSGGDVTRDEIAGAADVGMAARAVFFELRTAATCKLICSSSAARPLLPSASRSTSSILDFSTSPVTRRVTSASVPVRSTCSHGDSGVSLGSGAANDRFRWRGRIVSPSARITARSMQFCSSRTLPGQRIRLRAVSSACGDR